MYFKKSFFALLTALLFSAFIFTGCEESPEVEIITEEENSENSIKKTEPEGNFKISDVYIGTAGNTALMGFAKLMDMEEKEEAYNSYHFSNANTEEIISKFSNGDLDHIIIPTDKAAVLYNSKNGNIRITGINVLGGIYIIDTSNSVNSINDLSNKTININAENQNSLPEYILKYILDKNSIENVKINYVSNYDTLINSDTSNKSEIFMLSEPDITIISNQNQNIRKAIDITKEWENISGKKKLPMYVTITTAYYEEHHPRLLKHFIKECKKSAQFASQNKDENSVLMEHFKIMDNAANSKKALENSDINFIDGTEMKDMLNDLFNILYEYNPEFLGGTIPDENIFHME